MRYNAVDLCSKCIVYKRTISVMYSVLETQEMPTVRIITAFESEDNLPCFNVIKSDFSIGKRYNNLIHVCSAKV